MLKKITSTLIAICCIVQAKAQLTTNNAMTPAQMVQNYLVGTGVTVSNVTYTGYVNGISTYTSTASTNLGFSSGVYLTTGSCLANDPQGTGGQDGPFGPSSNFQDLSQGKPGDADLDLLTTAPTNDASILEFDFIPQSDTVKFRYRFGSEEYNEYVNSTYNDVFGFFLSGVTVALPKTNIALIPGTAVPVSINNVNNGMATGASTGPCTNCAYYTDNIGGAADIAYDGLTTILTAVYPVQCGQTYHIKIAIADVGDAAYDSGVFLEAGSFSSQAPVSISSNLTDSVITEGCGTTTLYFVRPLNQIANADTFNYTIGGTAANGLDFSPALTGSIIFPAGQDSVVINLSAINDGLTEPLETLTITLTQTFTVCGVPIVISYKLYIEDLLPLSLQTSDTTICIGQQATAAVHVTGGGSVYTYSWTQGSSQIGTTASITVAPTVSGWYVATVADNCGNSGKKDSVYVTVLNNPPLIQNMPDQHTCIDKPVSINTNITGGMNNVYTWTTISGTNIVQQIDPLTAQIAVALANGTYLLTVANSCNQYDTDTIQVYVEDCTVVFPNIVTPNEDGKNEVLFFHNLDKYPDTEINVYNRWGNKIYESENYQNNWKPDVSDGTYYYILKFTDKSTKASFFLVAR